MQGAGDGRRGEGQDVDVLLQRFQLFLVGDTEVLLLVDDHQAKLLELDRLRQERVGSDDDVDGALFDALLGRLRLGSGNEPR